MHWRHWFFATKITPISRVRLAVARQWIRCGTLAGQPQNAVLRAGDLWLLLRNCKPNFVLAAGYRVRAASCAHRGLPALFASVRRTRGHKRLSACAHGMPSNLSRPSRELLSSLAAKNFCCCCSKKNKSAVFACDRPNWGTYDI